MKTGISTASLFLRKPTEDALSYLSESGVPVCEVFLSTYSEYKREFGELLLRKKGKIEVNSVHDLNTQFEPQLYNDNPRAKADAYEILDSVLDVGKTIGAKYLTFHGVARLKRTPMKIDFDVIGKKTAEIMEHCAKKGLSLSYENVHWAFYNYIGFFTELQKRCPNLYGTLDVKQARQSGIFYGDYIDEMKGKISTVHVSDCDENGKMCLPGKGVFDFKELHKRLVDSGFDGSVIIEVYAGDYNALSELTSSLMYLNDIFVK